MQSRYTMNKKNKKPYIKRILIICALLIAGAATFWLYLHDWNVERSPSAAMEVLTHQSAQEQEVEAEQKIEDAHEEALVIPEEKAEEVDENLPVTPEPDKETAEAAKDATVYPESIQLPEEPTIIDGILLANKQNPLPSEYAPGVDPEAKEAFEAMRKEAVNSGMDLVAFSTFRDFNRQKELYEGYVAKDGQEVADRYS